MVFEAEVDDGLAPDLIVWLPDAAADLGAPILIEVERAMRWARGRDEIAARMVRYMGAARVRTGLVIVGRSGPNVDVAVVSGVYMFALSLDTLLDLAERGRLASGLIEARNRFVHGGP